MKKLDKQLFINRLLNGGWILSHAIRDISVVHILPISVHGWILSVKKYFNKCSAYLHMPALHYGVVTMNWWARLAGVVISLANNKLAMYVTYDHGGDAVYNDNCFTLLPTIKNDIRILRKQGAVLPDQPQDVWFLK